MNTESSSDNFYKNLQPFHHFDDVKDPANFQQAPDDWVVLLSDIKGSTQAATNGRYKEINMLGVSAIVLVANATQDLNTASVFGGDGATILMPEQLFQRIRGELAGLVRLAKEGFNHDLRVGAVCVKELKNRGYAVLVGKLQLSKTTQLAQFIGSGMSEAEDLIKRTDPIAMMVMADATGSVPNLNGLSCRLQPFASRHGQVLSLIVKPQEGDDSQWIRQSLLPNIKKILRNDFQSANPVSQQQLEWKWVPDTLGSEIRFSKNVSFASAKVAAHTLLANTLLKLNIPAGGFFPKRYKSEVALQSDFGKFDDSLRMVIDCSLQQRAELLALFAQAKTEGRIFYGTYSSERAIVTCLTYSASSGQHVHFVDGENCGYTRAAMDLKNQMTGQGFPR